MAEQVHVSFDLILMDLHLYLNSQVWLVITVLNCAALKLHDRADYIIEACSWSHWCVLMTPYWPTRSVLQLALCL